MELLDNIDIAIIKEIQDNIPLTVDPFGDIAEKVRCSKSEVLSRLERMVDSGIVRRIGSVLYHGNAGFKANGMFVCVVPDEQVEEAGRKLASIPGVSHCYQRRTYDNWPYNLYGMIHGRTKSEVEAIVKDFVEDMFISQYKILFSIHELKKVSMKYFCSPDTL